MTEKFQQENQKHPTAIKQSVRFVTVTEAHHGQRIDNFLLPEKKQSKQASPRKFNNK